MIGHRGVHIERLLDAPIEEVFAAWTEPETMARWLSPIGRAEVETDRRLGGAFRVIMIGDGMRIEHTGEYLVFDPPRRLSFTWTSPYTGPGASLVTVSLSEEGAQTRLILVHVNLPDGQVAGHRGGWAAMIDRLTELFQEAHADGGSSS